MIADPLNGNRVNFIPVNLLEGDETAVITLRITPEIADALLRGTLDAAASIKARIGLAAFQDLATTPLDLSGYFGGSVDIDFKVAASDPLPGVTRVLLIAGISRPRSAAWLL